MREWQTQTVEELVKQQVIERPLDGNHGELHPKGSDFLKSGVPFVMASDLVRGHVDIKTCAFISEERAKSLRKGFAREGDILLSHKATIGRTALVEKLLTDYIVLSPQVTYYRVLDSSRLNKRYLKYYFDSPFFQSFFQSWAGGGSTRAYLGIIGQLKLPIVVPPISEQNAIADFLGSLDNKIEHNQHTTQALENLAQAIFRAWFVDFEPIKAKAAGVTSFPSMPQAVFDNLPTSFVDSEIGRVPRGWRIGKINNIAKERREGVLPSDVVDDYPYIGLEHIPRRNIALALWGNARDVTSNKIRFSRGEILFGKLRPYFHKVGIAPVDGVCSTDIVVVNTLGNEWYGLLVGHLISDEFVAYTNACSSGTKMPRTSWRDMGNYDICIPSADVSNAFSEILCKLTEPILSSIFETRKLAEMRDYLLPKLLSGEVRVNRD